MEIIRFDEHRLRKKTKKVKAFDQELKLFIEGMKELMVKSEGVGLAAPQAGDYRRAFVFVDVKTGKIREIINPVIAEKSLDKSVSEEGCLSFPNLFLNIERSKEVEVEGYDTEGNKIRIKGEGIMARILQHEIDHLDGILFFDRLPFFKRIKFKYKNRGFNRFINKKGLS